MLRKIIFLVWILLISFAVIWLVNNNGSVTIIWLGREIITDILTVCILTVLLCIFTYLLLYLLIKVLSIKIKVIRFFKKDLSCQKDQIIKKYEKSIDLIIKFFLATNNQDEDEVLKIKKEIKSLIKNPELEKLLLAKISQLQGNDKKSEKLLSDISE